LALKAIKGGGSILARIEIRRLRSLYEYRECERLQMEVWGNLGAGSEVLQVTQKYGGVVLGAIAKGKLLGFLYAFLGRYHGRVIHWSHMMAVEKHHRDKGLGFRMKLVHRQLALQEGIKSICWTYDPLQSRNAALNIARLGARVEEYLPDCYGRFPSVIEKGLPSDRFVVNWQIGSAHVARRLRRPFLRHVNLNLPKINQTRRNDDGFIVNGEISFSFAEPRLLLEIPTNSDEMRVRALKLARQWRLETRRMFQRAFESGCRVLDFVTTGAGGDRRAFYVLSGARGERRS
jgi:predicted GNAT superfamily acetyltransferase